MWQESQWPRVVWEEEQGRRGQGKDGDPGLEPKLDKEGDHEVAN